MPKNVYIEKLDHIIYQFSNTYDRVKPADVKSSTYIDSSKKVYDIIRTSKYKSNFPKGSV